MNRRKRFLPFSWMPGAWGLKGNTRAIAEIEYYYEGYDRELMLLEHKYADNEKKFNEELIHLQYKHKMLSDRQYAFETLLFIEDEHERKLKQLELDCKYNGLSDHEYNKQLATLNNEPWWCVVETDVDKDEPTHGAIELDWNDQFVTLLESKGYIGKTANDTVDLWFSTLCKNIAMEEFAGVGSVEDDLEQASIIKKEQAGEGKWEAK